MNVNVFGDEWKKNSKYQVISQLYVCEVSHDARNVNSITNACVFGLGWGRRVFEELTKIWRAILGIKGKCRGILHNSLPPTRVYFELGWGRRVFEE